MTVNEVHESLHALRSNQEKTVLSAIDSEGNIKLGLNVACIRQLAKEIGQDSVLADELYNSDILEAKILATLIDHPESYSRDEMLMRSKQLYPSDFAKYFSYHVLAKCTHAVHFIDDWSHSNDEDLKVYAYYALQKMAKRKNSLSQAFYFDRLNTISRDIHHVSDEVAEAMMASIEAIGARNAYLKRMSEKTANSIQSIGQKNLAAERKNLLQSTSKVRQEN